MSEKVQRIFPTAKTRTSRFTRIDNALLRDRRLSFRARGVAAEVLSRPGTWIFSAESLAAEGQEGIHAMEGAIRELIAAGYVTRSKMRDPSTGHFITMLKLHEAPTGENRQSAPTGDLPTVGEPTGRSTGGRQTGSLRNDGLMNDQLKNEQKGGNEAPQPARAPSPSLKFSWPLNLPEDEAERIRLEHNVSAEVLRRGYEKFVGRKLTFRDPCESLDQAVLMFRTWLNATKVGRAYGRHGWESRPECSRAIDREPEGWRETLKQNRPDARILDDNRPWDQIPAADREAVISVLQEINTW